MSLKPYWDTRVRSAVKQFWATRGNQSRLQGARTGSRDAGNRTAVTGGKQMDGFVEVVRDYLLECKVRQDDMHFDKKVELPGWFRAEKKWDLLVIVGGKLIAAMEFKSQIGSFGNNFNNRAEEVLGSATDIWTAYREGAFSLAHRPWLGYLMLLEEVEASLSPVSVKEPHFQVFPEFRDASYAKRYEILMSKLVRERLYDSSALLLSSKSSTQTGDYREPASELSFENLLVSLKARAMAIHGATN
ncbi:MAG TPA: PaeR7I family type II restriction endonuclease [Terracidiphilus sp.]|nr:PaeR7I family type II restriction endonuclease [Terracidiphilus sp.]